MAESKIFSAEENAAIDDIRRSVGSGSATAHMRRMIAYLDEGHDYGTAALLAERDSDVRLSPFDKAVLELALSSRLPFRECWLQMEGTFPESQRRRYPYEF